MPKVSTDAEAVAAGTSSRARATGGAARLGWLTHETAGCFSSHCASSSALSLWRCTRSDSVSSPCRNRNELKGESARPEVAQPLDAGADDERDVAERALRAEGLPELEAVVARARAR